MTTKTIRDVEVFAVGEWNDKAFERDDLDEMVRAFDELKLADRLPVKLGHDARDDTPAQGWISELRREGNKLLATLAQVPAELVEAIKEGRWRHVSIELLGDVTAGGETYRWVPCGLAILGSARPAVDVLRPLHELIARALPRGIQFRERLAFSREPSEVEQLRAEIRRMHRDGIKRELDDAIRSGRILPRDRHLFETRMGVDATIEQARKWIDETPKPQTFSRERRPGGGGQDSRADERDTMPDGDRPDVTMAQLVAAEVEKSGGKLDYLAAQRVVMRRDSALAERYRHMPGTKG